MEGLICPNCKISLNLVTTTKIPYYICNECNLKIKTKYSNHILTPKELNALVSDGKTGNITFMSSHNKPFETYLVIVNNRVDYGFNQKHTAESKQTEENKSNMEDPYVDTTDETPTDTVDEAGVKINTVNLRVESPAPGSVMIEILNLPKYYKQMVNFGLASSRECECLATIAAAQYIKWHLKDVERFRLTISANNLEFVNYILKENKPRDKEMQYLIFYAWEVLDQFKSWNVVYSHKRKQLLEGGNTSNTFPRGLFPWLEIDYIEADDYIGVKMPYNPVVMKQFKASIRSAELKGNPVNDKTSVFYTVPIIAEKALKSWATLVSSK